MVSTTTLDVEPPQKRLRRTQTRLTVPKKITQNSGDNALINLIVKDLQPFQIVENSGFQEYSKALNADYQLPNRKQLALMVDEKYKLVSESLKKELENIYHLALTSDIWTSDSNKSFISLTAHYIYEYKLKSVVISTSEIQIQHTAENIALAIQEVMDQWQISSKVVTIVTDNAAAMKKAVSECLTKRNHFCVAHTLNLAVKDCIEKETFNLAGNTSNCQLQELLAKCRAIVSHFKHSPKASYALLKVQEQLNVNTLKLKQDVRTRWNSIFYMLERLLEVKIPLFATFPQLDSSPPNLDSNEWLIMEDVVALLRPFENVTVILSGEKYPSLSSVIPLVLGLRNAIENKAPVTELGKNLKRSLSAVIEKRLAVYKTNRTASKATFLDPRFKKKGFTLESNANNAQMWVINELSNMSTDQVLPSSSPNSPSTSIVSAVTTLGKDDIWGVVDKKIMESCVPPTSYTSAAMMVKQYIELPYLDRKCDPLQFWNDKKCLFPRLSKIAQKYLCIPASSVPSERLFSKAGILCNDRRNRLAPKKVDQILFLNSIP
ncbi:unnamed protein product [Diatraea saccharalis]|uniref:HAT C-terminal dimerisation domain-containing protein n=1 Tax=Diatraea saccharalis TaxID=40085 RepID=A0A9N9R2D5_9NEOP|nr:unnamed protein product [Diatraea saccharalis]